jgi:uncharacterized membrane protein YgaE (UPF0421/DUF939 family)
MLAVVGLSVGITVSAIALSPNYYYLKINQRKQSERSKPITNHTNEPTHCCLTQI